MPGLPAYCELDECRQNPGCPAIANPPHFPNRASGRFAVTFNRVLGFLTDKKTGAVRWLTFHALARAYHFGRPVSCGMN